jgi:hypothetical protein
MLEVAQYLTSSYITKQSLLKTAWYWPRNRHEDQWNTIEDQYMNTYNFAHLIFDKVANNILWRKDSHYNKCCWERWLSSARNRN